MYNPLTFIGCERTHLDKNFSDFSLITQYAELNNVTLQSSALFLLNKWDFFRKILTEQISG